MTDRIRCVLGGRWAVIGLVALLLAPAPGWADSFDPSRLRWSSLSFRARKLFFSFETELEVEVVPSAELGRTWIDSSEGHAVQPDSGSVVQLTLGAHGMGRTSETRLWIDPESAVAIQRSQVRSKGRKRRQKTMRFTDKGVQVVTRRPVSGEDPDRPESWTRRKARFDTFPSWADGDLRLSEPTALFYLLAAAALDKPGDRVEFPILSDGDVIMVELLVAGWESLEVDYVVVEPAGERAVRGSVRALKISLSGRLLDPHSTTANLQFMGMKGDIRVYLDPATRAPLQVSGRVPVAGRAHARIQRLVLEE